MDVTHKLESVASLEDLSEVRTLIQKGAAELKTSVDRMAEEGKRALTQLKTEISGYQVKLEEAEEIASRDMLTGLHNRLWVERQIERRIEACTPFCIAVIDVDDFKQVNDNYGHLVGDELLQQFAAELQYANRSRDVIGRWGGDEFILMLDCQRSDASAQIDRLATSVCRSYEVHAKAGPVKLTLGASIGLTEHIPGEALKELLARADAAMYLRKADSHSHGTEKKQQPPTTMEPMSQAPQIGAAQGRKTMRSLVAEDDATNRKLLQAVLSRYGQCDIAVDGKEAVSLARCARENHQSYDLVCMDLRMPQMDGQEAIREIRKQEAIAGVTKAVKIIVTTVHTDMEDIAGALLGRCNAYLVKPIDVAKLRKELKKLDLIQ
jgi:two-component system chemotaxis response regulator CheY